MQCDQAAACNIQQAGVETAEVMSTFTRAFTRADASGRRLAGGLALGTAGIACWHMKNEALHRVSWILSGDKTMQSTSTVQRQWGYHQVSHQQQQREPNKRARGRKGRQSSTHVLIAACRLRSRKETWSLEMLRGRIGHDEKIIYLLPRQRGNYYSSDKQLVL